MSKPWLVAQGVRKGYSTLHRSIEVLRGVDLEVHQGEAVAITGSSGSGKTTLLNILGSLDHPEGGSILWEGQEIFKLGDRSRSRLRNRTLGFVFQSHHLLPDFTALENVLMPIRIGGTSMTEGRSRALELLGRVGLSNRVEHKPGELSGGEQQRVAVARALVHGPRLVLADEPGGNLDRKTADELHDLLLELRSEQDMGMVVVTHDETLARRTDRWLHLEAGHLQQRHGAQVGGGAEPIMNCHRCGERPAKVQYTEVTGVEKDVQWLCDVCAEDQGLVSWTDDMETPVSTEEGAASFLATLVVEGPSASASKGVRRCSTCGITLSTLRRTGRLGCGDCYDTFRENLEPLLRRVHGATQHRGAGPGGLTDAARIQRELSGLNKDLEEAVRREDYERAAALRDQIQRCQTQLSQGGGRA